MLFKFQVNRMKIEDFRNLGQIGLFAYFALLAFVYLKINRWLNLHILGTYIILHVCLRLGLYSANVVKKIFLKHGKIKSQVQFLQCTIIF